jgi:uncharacterized protein involved in response to NO
MNRTSRLPGTAAFVSFAVPPILQNGFRPFFFLAAAYAAIAIPAWLALYASGFSMPGAFDGLDWHVHEMLFGYLGAVIAGFILTAIPNWTGRLPLRGWPLAGLALLWAVGRLACAFVADPLAAMLLDLLFPLALAGAVWREIAAGRNRNNAPVAVMLTLLALANAAHHAGNAGVLGDSGFSVRLALAVVATLIALIGGRIVPSFSRNWLAKAGEKRFPAPFGRLDQLALAATACGALMYVAAPAFFATGIVLALAGVLLLVRLARWRGQRAADEPILLILHIGYAWLAVALAALGASIVSPLIPATAALHALTAGAIGTMTLAVMTRASLGHTGRNISADAWTRAIYVLVNLGALLRVSAPFDAEIYLAALLGGGIAWSAAFLLFAVRYAPILWGRRAGA